MLITNFINILSKNKIQIVNNLIPTINSKIFNKIIKFKKVNIFKIKIINNNKIRMDTRIKITIWNFNSNYKINPSKDFLMTIKIKINKIMTIDD